MLKPITGVAAGTLMLTSAAFGAEPLTRALSFENEGSTLAGTLYLPADYRAGGSLPAVVVTGAWTSVQEQMPKNYAQEMAKRGFAAFTFDFRGWGKSGDLADSKRYREDPAAKTDDIRAAIDFVASLPEVDSSQLNGLGICASAGYMVDATAGNPKIRSVGLVAPWSGFLPGFDETLHLLSNHTITSDDGDTATMQADFQASHRIDQASWVLSGHYEYELVRAASSWVVASLTMAWTHETGDRGLVGVAAERARPKSG